jgi:antibiotic biosynthesis monooxygenase
MILVLRRWFVPSERMEEFISRWRREIRPLIVKQPGCVRAEVYASSIRGHWVTSVLWSDEASRMQALAQLAGVYNEFRPYERFEPEVLTLLED